MSENKAKTSSRIYSGLTGFLVLFALLFSSQQSAAQAFTEGFDDVTLLASSGWVLQNNSDPAGDGWYSGDTAIFAAHSGAPGSYILAYSGNTIGTGTISNWLLTPARTLRNGDVVSFYTRKVSPDLYPDRLQLRMSTSGNSANTGNTATSTGDFNTLLLDINPALAQGVYPVSWTQFSVTISGLPAPVSGRFGLRYFVTNGGPTGDNSELIGIDEFVYSPNCPVITLSPAALPAGNIGDVYSETLSQTGGSGTIDYSITSGMLPAGVTLSSAGLLAGTPIEAGSFPVTILVTDTSGCTASANYTLSIGCTPSFAPLAPVCHNAAPVTLTGASPAGGVYTGTGVSGGVFSPTAGTQVITYTYTTASGCTGTATQTQTVNICSGTDDNLLSSRITCFPNPSSGKFTVKADLPAAGKVQLRLFTIQGRFMRDLKTGYSEPAFEQEIDLNSFPKGMYVLELSSAYATGYTKIILQ